MLRSLKRYAIEVKRVMIVISVAGLLLWLLTPTTDVVAPDWSVVVIDTAGHPIEGARVTLFAQQYTLERVDTETEKITNRAGETHFEGRKLRANRLVRFVGVIRNLDQGAHASFGVHTHLAAFKEGYGDPSTLDLFARNERESRANGLAVQSSRITLVQCPSGYSGFGCDFPTDPDKPVLPPKK